MSHAPATVLVAQSIGQVGNRLEQFSHLIALSRETGCRILNPAFSLYAEYFAGTASEPLCAYPPARPAGSSRKALQRFLYYFVRAALEVKAPHLLPRTVVVDVHWSAGAYDLGNPQFQRFLRDERLVVLAGHWKHRYWQVYDRHIEAIRAHFRLVPELEKKVGAAIEAARQGVDVLVGLHVRQGDNFTDPVRRDAFTSEEYAAVARRLAGLFPGRRVGFLLCTNKDQPMELYRGLDVRKGPGDFIPDMYALAGCDYIVGAGQSSFSGWASLMGQKPRYRLFDPARPINLEDFEVCRGVED